MTANERIEKLLNHFGQTIADLPSTKDHDWSGPAYGIDHLFAAKKSAYVWMWEEYQDADIIPICKDDPPLLDYICHLADVIDRMEVALETALRIISLFSTSCFLCAENDDCDMSHCDFTIDDTFLSTYLE